MTAATSTIQIQVDAKPALRSLADIKKAVQDNTSVLDRFRQASAGGFDRLEAAMNKAVGAVDRMHSTMAAMASGMGAGTAAALKQAQAMDRLAQAAKASEAAKQRAISTQRQEIANQRQWEVALTRETGLRERLRRQLAGDQHASARNELGNQLTTAMSTYESALKKFGSGSLEGVKARGTLSREFAMVSSRIAEINGLLPALDKGFDKVAKSSKGWMRNFDHRDRMMITAWLTDVPQQIIAGGGANAAQALAVQGPEIIAMGLKLPGVAKATIGGLLGLGTAAGLAVAAIGRLADASQRMKDFSANLRGSGQAGLMAADDLALLADRLNTLPGVSRTAADATVAALSKIRGLGQQNLSRVGTLAPDYARLTGEDDIAKAGADLGKLVASPVEAARKLMDAYGALDFSQVRTIDRLAATGRGAEAQRMVLDALEKQVRGMSENTMGPWAKTASAMGDAWDAFIGKLSNSAPIKAAADALEGMALSMAGFLGNSAAGAKAIEREIALLKERRKWVATDFARSNIDSEIAVLEAQRTPKAPVGVLSLPMPAPLPAGALPGLVDGRKEVNDVLALLDGYRGLRGERERLADQASRVRAAMKLTDRPEELRMLQSGLADIGERMRQAVDPRAKAIIDAQRSAAGAWEVARAPYDQREQVTARLQAEAQAREAGMGAMQREALVRERLSELSAKGLQSVGDSVRAKLEESDAAMRLADVDGMGIVAQQQATDAIARETFARQALAKASNDNMAAVLAEIDTYGRLVTKLGEANVASQFRSRARSASPTIQHQESLRNAQGTVDYMTSMGASGDEIKRYWEDIELSKLNASQKWLDGVKRANIQYQRSAMDAATGAANAFTTSFDTLNDTLTDFVTTGKMKVGDFVNTVARQFASMTIKQTITAPLANWFSGLFSANGNVFSPSGHLSAYAKGGAFNDNYPLHAFAKGGAFTNSIVSEPTLFKFAKGTGLMGEAGPEAIMPLERAADGSLGVRANMSPLAYGPEAAAQVVDASNTSNITVAPNISVNVQGSASGNAQQDTQFANEIASKTVREMRDSVRAIVADEINRAQRPGGMMNRLR